MQGPGENTKSDSGAQGNNPGKPASNAQTAMDRNRQKQVYFDQIAETEYGKQRLRIFHELAFLNSTHKKGKFSNSDEAINGITAWLAANPYADAGDLLDIVSKWLKHAKKDEASWSSDGKIFPDKLEAILWRSILAFIRQLDRKELTTSLNAGPGSEAERLMHIARIQELEASEKQLRDSERQMETTLQEQTTQSSLQKQKLASTEKETARLQNELAAEKKANEQVIDELKQELSTTKEDLKKVAATAATLEAEKARNAAEKEANEQVIARLRQELATTKGDLKMVSAGATSLEAEKARNLAEKEALARENTELKERLKSLDQKLQAQEGTVTQVNHTILERLNEVAEQSRKINLTLTDRNLSFFSDSHAGTSSHNEALLAPLPKTVMDCITYLRDKHKGCISPTRLTAIVSLGRFLSSLNSLSSTDLSAFAVEGVKNLTNDTQRSSAPELFINGLLGQIMRFEKALDLLKAELQQACELQQSKNPKEDLTKRELYKGLFNLFKDDVFNVAMLREYFDKILIETRPKSDGLSTSADGHEATKEAVFLEPAVPNRGFFQAK